MQIRTIRLWLSTMLSDIIVLLDKIKTQLYRCNQRDIISRSILEVNAALSGCLLVRRRLQVEVPMVTTCSVKVLSNES